MTVNLSASDSGLQSDSNDKFRVNLTVYGPGATVDG